MERIGVHNCWLILEIGRVADLENFRKNAEAWVECHFTAIMSTEYFLNFRLIDVSGSSVFFIQENIFMD